jgi:hypothetical protein
MIGRALAAMDKASIRNGYGCTAYPFEIKRYFPLRNVCGRAEPD